MYRAATARRVRIRQAEQSSFSGRTARGDLHHHEGLPRREAQAWLERRDGVRRATICLDPDDLAAGSAARSALAEGGSTDRLVKSGWETFFENRSKRCKRARIYGACRLCAEAEADSYQGQRYIRPETLAQSPQRLEFPNHSSTEATIRSTFVV